MNSKFLRGLLCLIAGSLTAIAGEFDQANQQFRAGDFASAAAGYEKILKTDGPDAAVFYNLGNSYQRLGQYGPAILAYERARLLTPRDQDLSVNLMLARKAANVSGEVGVYPPLDPVLNSLSRDEWAWLVGVAALVTGGLSAVCGAVRLPAGAVRRWVVGLICFAGFCIVSGATALYLRRAEASRGVVLSDTAVIRLSPFETADAVSNVRAGMILQLGGKSGDFYDVKASGTNLRGWLASRDVEAILAKAPQR